MKKEPIKYISFTSKITKSNLKKLKITAAKNGITIYEQLNKAIHGCK